MQTVAISLNKNMAKQPHNKDTGTENSEKFCSGKMCVGKEFLVFDGFWKSEN